MILEEKNKILKKEYRKTEGDREEYIDNRSTYYKLAYNEYDDK